MAEAHDIDPVEEHTALADAASLRARCAALEACLRELVAFVSTKTGVPYPLDPGPVLRARALLGEKP